MDVYGNIVLDITTVRRGVSRVIGNPREKWETDLSDRLCRGRPAAAVNKDKDKQALITDNKRISVSKLCESFQVGHGNISNLTQPLGYSNVWAVGSQNAD